MRLVAGEERKTVIEGRRDFLRDYAQIVQRRRRSRTRSGAFAGHRRGRGLAHRRPAMPAAFSQCRRREARVGQGRDREDRHRHRRGPNAGLQGTRRIPGELLLRAGQARSGLHPVPAPVPEFQRADHSRGYRGDHARGRRRHAIPPDGPRRSARRLHRWCRLRGTLPGEPLSSRSPSPRGSRTMPAARSPTRRASRSRSRPTRCPRSSSSPRPSGSWNCTPMRRCP